MGKERNHKEMEIEENVVKKLSWKMGQRDDVKVAQELHHNKEIEGIYGLEESGLLDGFFLFLEEMGVVGLLKKITPKGIQRVMVSFFQFVLLYLLKILFGVESMHSLPELLFCNEGAMQLVGFNAEQISNGVCNRGNKKRKHKEKQGPICDDALSRNIVKIPLNVIEKLFNGVVKLLAKKGIFPKRMSAIIDPTDIRTTEKYEGCGTVTRTKRVKDKEGKIKEIKIKVWGWKLMVVFYGRKKIPLAAKVMKIQESENNHTIELIKKAQKNLGDYSKIVRVVMDRGHLDGKDLWWIDQQGIEFVIPAKGNMGVTEDARALAEKARKTNDGVEIRRKKQNRGIGKGRWVETLETAVVGIKGLTTYDQYGPPGFEKDAYKKSFRPHKINAIVVVKWDGKDYGRDNWVVYLTNMRVHKPLKVFDEYDERSIIENCLFKESKSGWHIAHSPQKTEAAITVHMFFTLMVFALTNAYREWCRKQEVSELQDPDEPSLGIERWRQEIKRKGKNKGLVFIGNHYGIFWLAEIVILLGAKIKDIPKKLGSRKEVLARYGLQEA